MSQSLSMIYIHLVFSTKNRKPFLSDRVLRNDMHAYLAGSIKTTKCVPVQVVAPRTTFMHDLNSRVFWTLRN